MRLRCTFLTIAFTFMVVAPLQASQWPRWRGPNGNGRAEGNPPVEWSESKNIRWKTAIPGTGHATPIMWDNRIYVQTAEEVRPKSEESAAVYQFKLLAIDRKTGKPVWEKVLREATQAQVEHDTSTQVNISGLTDGEHLYANFGSMGLYCLDFDGKIKWEKDLGEMQTHNNFGEGSTPTIHGNRMVVNWDHEGSSFIVALDKRTGKELWRTSRDEKTTWVSPAVIEHKGVNHVVVPATGKTRSYDLATGKLIWECAGLGALVVPTPIHADGIVYVTSGHSGSAMQAILLDKAKGDITGTDAVLWSISRNTPYVSSPILYGDRMFFVKGREGILSSYNAKTGEQIYGPERLPRGVGHVYASLTGTKNHFYVPGRNGTTLTVKNSPMFEIMAANVLDQGISASPVIVDNELFLRTYTHLYCIAEE